MFLTNIVYFGKTVGVLKCQSCNSVVIERKNFKVNQTFTTHSKRYDRAKQDEDVKISSRTSLSEAWFVCC